MSRSAALSGFLLCVIGLTGLCGPALAGSLAGRTSGSGQINLVSTGPGPAVASGLGTGLNVMVPATAPVTTSPNGINVQTNIDNTRTIDASNTINVTDTVNDSSVAYGGNGASINWPQSNALAVIDGMANFNATVSANNGPDWMALADTLKIATFLSDQQQQNN